jgi:hypothetical protein
LLSEFHDRGKRLGVETRAADERSVDIHLSHQALDIVGLDASAVKDSQPGGPLRRKVRLGQPPQEFVRVRGNIRGRGAAGANGPDWLLS